MTDRTLKNNFISAAEEYGRIQADVLRRAFESLNPAVLIHDFGNGEKGEFVIESDFPNEIKRLHELQDIFSYPETFLEQIKAKGMELAGSGLSHLMNYDIRAFAEAFCRSFSDENFQMRAPEIYDVKWDNFAPAACYAGPPSEFGSVYDAHIIVNECFDDAPKWQVTLMAHELTHCYMAQLAYRVYNEQITSGNPLYEPGQIALQRRECGAFGSPMIWSLYWNDDEEDICNSVQNNLYNAMCGVALPEP